ncbi:hypothetical protein [Halorientalis halophila]|uniref:hypothetical protein n=1 Tax=Halorientalis halophila TaxID=3108499 RepID=UPI00300B1A8B
MSIDIGAVLHEGIDRLASAPGLTLVGAFLALGLANVVVTQSMTVAFVEFVVDELGPQLSETRELEQFRQSTGPTPFAVSLAPSLLAVLFLLLAVVTEALSVVAVRVFAGDADDPWTGATDRLPMATLNAFVAGILAFVLIALAFVVGLIGLIVGGFVLAAFVAISLLFVRQEVALEDENFLGALSESWDRAKGNRWQLLALILLFGVLGASVGVVGGLGSFLGPEASTILSVTFGAITGAFGIAATTRAYEQLRGPEETDETTDFDDGEEWDDPAGV